MIVFLKNLKENNNKQKIESRKQGYENYLLLPMKNLVADLEELMFSIDSDFETRAAVDKPFPEFIAMPDFHKTNRHTQSRI